MTRVDVPARELRGASEAAVRVFRERLSCRGIPPRPREPEVDQMEPPCVFPGAEDEVARFDVAVDDALPVDVLEDVQLRAVAVSVRRLFGLTARLERQRRTIWHTRMTRLRCVSRVAPIFLMASSRFGPRRSITRYSKYWDLPHATTLGMPRCSSGHTCESITAA